VREIYTEWTSKKRIFREPIHPGRWRVSFGFGLFGNGSTATARKIFQILDVSSFIGVHRCSSVAKIPFSEVRPSLEGKNKKNCHRFPPLDPDTFWPKRPAPENPSDFTASRSPESLRPMTSQILNGPKKQMNRRGHRGRRVKNRRFRFSSFPPRTLRPLRFKFFFFSKQPSGPLTDFDFIGVIP